MVRSMTKVKKMGFDGESIYSEHSIYEEHKLQKVKDGQASSDDSEPHLKELGDALS